MNNSMKRFWAVLRIGVGWVFLWAFVDKVWGLGFATKPEGAWLNGGSPTAGFLGFATKGPFAEIFKSMAGNGLVDWLFMLGLLLIGLALMLGIGIKIASWGGFVLLILMYMAGFIPPEHNPIIDDHIIYAIVMLGFPMYHAGRYWGFGSWWENTSLVKKYRFLA